MNADTNGRANLYIADILDVQSELGMQEATYADFVGRLVDHVQTLFIDPVGPTPYSLRVVFKGYNSSEPTPPLNRVPTQRQATRILKPGYVIKGDLRRALGGGVSYTWFDGSINEVDIEETRRALLELENIGPTFVTGRRDPYRIHARGFVVGEEGVVNLRNQMVKLPIRDLIILRLVGPSEKEVDVVDSELEYLIR